MPTSNKCKSFRSVILDKRKYRRCHRTLGHLFIAPNISSLSMADPDYGRNHNDILLRLGQWFSSSSTWRKPLSDRTSWKLLPESYGNHFPELFENDTRSKWRWGHLWTVPNAYGRPRLWPKSQWNSFKTTAMILFFYRKDTFVRLYGNCCQEYFP